MSVEPSTALRAYLAAAIESQGGQRLCPPGVLARKVVQRPTSSPFVTDFCLQAVNRALASDATSPSFGTSTTEERTAGLDAVIRTVLPNVLKSPTSSSASQRWLVRLVRRAMQSSKQNTSDKVTVEKVREGLRAVLAQLDGTETGVLGELKNELQELLARSSPRARKRTPAPVKIDDFDLSRRGVDPDAALYCADLVRFLLYSFPRRRCAHSLAPRPFVHSYSIPIPQRAWSPPGFLVSFATAQIRRLFADRPPNKQRRFSSPKSSEPWSGRCTRLLGMISCWSRSCMPRCGAESFLGRRATLTVPSCPQLPQALKACREAAPQHLVRFSTVLEPGHVVLADA